jgi:proteic killer suppression protein
MFSIALGRRGMNLTGYRLHQLKSNRAGTWSVTVSGNWRVTFTFEGEDAFDVTLKIITEELIRC